MILAMVHPKMCYGITNLVDHSKSCGWVRRGSTNIDYGRNEWTIKWLVTHNTIHSHDNVPAGLTVLRNNPHIQYVWSNVMALNNVMQLLELFHLLVKAIVLGEGNSSHGDGGIHITFVNKMCMFTIMRIRIDRC